MPQLPQHTMIRRVKQLCQEDERLVAALMYGSFTQGEGDAFSDIEFYLFFRDDELDALDQAAWVSQVAPLTVFFTHEFGTKVAIFDNLVRGEFHFEPAVNMKEVRAWPIRGETLDIDTMLLSDRMGTLREHLETLKSAELTRTSPEALQTRCYTFINWWLLGFNVLVRGERARALDALSHVHRSLLYLVRAAEDKTEEHWLTPSKRLEADLSSEAYARFTACTSDLSSLEGAYKTAWIWGKELIRTLEAAHGFPLPDELLQRLDKRLAVAKIDDRD